MHGKSRLKFVLILYQSCTRRTVTKKDFVGLLSCLLFVCLFCLPLPTIPILIQCRKTLNSETRQSQLLQNKFHFRHFTLSHFLEDRGGLWREVLGLRKATKEQKTQFLAALKYEDRKPSAENDEMLSKRRRLFTRCHDTSTHSDQL
jgi:hypothetical protein